MKIYTKTGDSGTTGLFAGPRVTKCHPRISTYGTVDELNALLGLLVAELAPSTEIDKPEIRLDELIPSIQSDLFSIGAELATPDPDSSDMRLLTDARITALEECIDQADALLPQLTTFILPGGVRSAATLHLARTVCRRAERDVVHLSDTDPDCDCRRIVIYLNRLSDLLFVLARYENHRHGVVERPWKRPTQ